MFTRSMSVLAFFVCCSFSYAEDAVEIPLSEIWAMDMPGTKDIRELEQQDKFKEMSATDRIKNSLVENTRWLLNINNRPKYGSVAPRGTVVGATGLLALEQANAILADKQPRKEHFDSTNKLSLVFFAYESAKCVQLRNVQVTDKEVTVEYEFAAHKFPKSTSQIALIPLGKLSPGTRYVSIKRVDGPTTESELMQHRQAVARQVVCDSFTFDVGK